MSFLAFVQHNVSCRTTYFVAVDFLCVFKVVRVLRPITDLISILNSKISLNSHSCCKPFVSGQIFTLALSFLIKEMQSLQN